jgi:hypothetical protein
VFAVLFPSARSVRSSAVNSESYSKDLSALGAINPIVFAPANGRIGEVVAESAQGAIQEPAARPSPLAAANRNWESLAEAPLALAVARNS